MRTHHLNCGTLRPLGRRLVNGDGLPVQVGRLVCHCLLIEIDRGLVLVDTGFGLGDIAEHRGSPRRAAMTKLRSGRRKRTRLLTRPLFDPDETAVRQVVRLGFSPRDVTDVVMTHLDSDHAGGLPDFPWARVHVLESEHAAALSPPTGLERARYWEHQWAHDPEWVTYAPARDERWFGFEAVRELRGLPGFALVALPGHSRGHAGVAIEGGADGDARWLLHAGDTYFFHGEIDPGRPRTTPGLARFQSRLEVDGAARRHNQERLRELVAAHRDEVELFCSHDPGEYDRYARA